ncbi:MAG: group 1 truncated hemoglobin [Myxococcales bacterium]|nr:group 1 truncated hemoglobin [Myxococcales bacterium]
MTSLFDDIGGRPALARVHRIFYDKVYAHHWLRRFFAHVPQQVIEDQQTDFMTQAMGGPAVYCGRLPVAAHKHMFITDELFELRHQLLAQSLEEGGVRGENARRWLKIDAAFRGKLTKRSLDECEKRFNTDTLLSFANPA